MSGFFFSTGDIYEEATHHNAVFVGRDEDGVPRYAHQRGTAGSFRLDVKGSDKAFNFCYRGEGERLFVFEAPIDLLSFLCLFKKEWQKQSYLALGGVGEKALLRFLSDRPNIKTVYLCLDSDQAGSGACSRLAEFVPEGLTVHRLVPLYKDWNEVLQHRAEIADGKYIREAIYGLKEPPQEETVEIIRMSEVDTQTVEWLWEPYIPFGKVTIVQGNPGEGKTTFALRLAAACTTGGTLPRMKSLPPFQVIYQTAEDGLGDTIKPRLMEAEADLDRVLVIDEAKRELTLSDERIEKAITQNGARLIILDPIQAYMGEKTDMNRANEVRPMFRRLADVAERTGCAVILIGHLNKAAGGQSAYLSEDDAMLAAETQYCQMEQELQRYLDTYESTHDYDEYHFDLDDIEHDPYVLISILSALHEGEFTLDEVQGTLQMLFEKQYILTEEVIVETRYRTETDIWTDADGNTHTETYRVPYDYYICNVKLENFNLSHVPVYIMSQEQLSMYATYMSVLGNREDLFGDSPYVDKYITNPPADYDVNPEYLNDEKFAALITEAEKYLGYPYVWGGSNPDTSFDCSGFVSYVLTNSGLVNTGRLGAQGLYNVCTPVSKANAQPGDLIFFVGTYDTPGVSHVGIYVGDGVMIHCGDPIQYTSINSSYWQQHFYAFGRPAY